METKIIIEKGKWYVPRDTMTPIEATENKEYIMESNDIVSVNNSEVEAIKEILGMFNNEFDPIYKKLTIRLSELI